MSVLSDDAVEEIQTAINELGLTLSGARPWKSEFFAVFKPPKDGQLEQRVSTNILHYKANYCQIVCGAILLSIVTSPRTLFAITLSLGLCLLILLVRLPRRIEFGEIRFRPQKHHRILTAFASVFIILAVTGTLFWLLFIFASSLLFVLLHAIFRPRSLAARYDAATQDVRQLFSFGDTKSSTHYDTTMRVDPF